jgi:hypothetical protein
MTHESPAETPGFDPTDWRQALAAWQQEERRADEAREPPRMDGRVPAGWWQAAFTDR